MKRFLLIFAVFGTSLFYSSCQKEASGNVPAENTPQDSTTTGIDTTVKTISDSLTIRSFSPESGTIGTFVTITGTGFDSIPTGNTVAINSTPAKVRTATKSMLTVEVLAGTKTGKLLVTANGKTATSRTDFVVLTDSTATGKNAWKRKGDFPVRWASTKITAITVGNKGYFYQGTELWEYNPTLDQWTKKSDRPAGPGGFYAFAFSINNKIYIGSNNANMPDSVALWEYAIATDSWTRKRNLPIAPRLAAFGFSVNNTGYVGGGQIAIVVDSIFAHDFWKYNAENDTWSRRADFPGAWTISLSHFVIDNEAYVYDAGLGYPQAPTYGAGQGRLWHYNEATNSWTEKASCPGGAKAMSAVAFALAGNGYVAVSAFDRDKNPKDDFWMYNPATNAWTKKADVGGGFRLFGCGFAIGNKGYVGLGTGNTVFDEKRDFWEYTPD